MHLNNSDALVRVVDLKKVFRSGESDLVLFENLSFEVRRGEMLALVGASGSGKSTLLHILGALERASHGDVYCANLQLNSLPDDAAADFRNRAIGFVWQFHYLLPEFTALENVAMPLLMRGHPWQAVQKEAAGWLREVGLEARGHHRSGELSGGEQQRVALARALVNKPAILLADEPTGNLDSKTGDEIMTLITEINRSGVTVLMVTHDQARAEKYARRMIVMRDGKVVSDGDRP